MVVFLLGLILFSLSAPLSLWLRQKVEALLPAAMLGIILVLYVAGLFGSLAAGFYLCWGWRPPRPWRWCTGLPASAGTRCPCCLRRGWQPLSSCFF